MTKTIQKTVTFAPPGWGRNLRPQAVKLLLACKQPGLGVRCIQINLSGKGISVTMEAPDELTIERAQKQLQWRLDEEWHANAS